jgi:hypothetical protein
MKQFQNVWEMKMMKEDLGEIETSYGMQMNIFIANIH